MEDAAAAGMWLAAKFVVTSDGNKKTAKAKNLHRAVSRFLILYVLQANYITFPCHVKVIFDFRLCGPNRADAGGLTIPTETRRSSMFEITSCLVVRIRTGGLMCGLRKFFGGDFRMT
jgi:hypothetical protein